jgi:hypothetical protein
VKLRQFSSSAIHDNLLAEALLKVPRSVSR